MSDQPNLFDTPARARTSDPATSREAASSVGAMRASQARIMAIFRAYGDLTDEELSMYVADVERQLGIKLMSPSGVRSRRSELAKANMERLDEIAANLTNDGNKFFEVTNEVQDSARAHLRREGFRSPLWDTGVRRTTAAGRKTIVWGIAK